MTLPSSGVMTWEMIRAEFGGSYPVQINQYYRGGALVPNTAQNANVPTSGLIAASHFYGAGATVPPMVNISNQSIRRSISALTRLGYELNNAGEAWQRKSSGNDRIPGEWMLTGAVGDYEARYDLIAGSGSSFNAKLVAGSTLTTAYQSLATTRWLELEWTGAQKEAFTIRVYIRKISTGVELDSADILLEKY